jgi:hypothetical protein
MDRAIGRAADPPIFTIPGISGVMNEYTVHEKYWLFFLGEKTAHWLPHRLHAS